MQMNKEVNAGRWKPLKITRAGPNLSHVMFADDIIFFGVASENQLGVMMSVLDPFCSASGVAFKNLSSYLNNKAFDRRGLGLALDLKIEGQPFTLMSAMRLFHPMTQFIDLVI